MNELLGAEDFLTPDMVSCTPGCLTITTLPGRSLFELGNDPRGQRCAVRNSLATMVPGLGPAAFPGPDCGAPPDSRRAAGPDGRRRTGEPAAHRGRVAGARPGRCRGPGPAAIGAGRRPGGRARTVGRNPGSPGVVPRRSSRQADICPGSRRAAGALGFRRGGPCRSRRRHRQPCRAPGASTGPTAPDPGALPDRDTAW